MARIAHELAQKTMPRYSHPKSPHHFTLPQLTACVLLMFYLDRSYRDMEEWLLASDRVCRALEPKRVPDRSTLYRAHQRPRMADLNRIQSRWLAALEVQEETIPVDATGYRPTQASADFQTLRGRPWREYRKASYAVGTQS